MATLERNKLIQLIHVAKSKLVLDDETYQAILHNATGKTSCSDMNPLELSRVLDVMRAKGFVDRSAKRNPATKADVGGLSPRQVYYIKGLFDLACRSTSEHALRALVRRQTGVDDLRFVPRAKASALILMLKDIADKAGFDPDGPRGAS